jgi:hypothetical protein
MSQYDNDILADPTGLSGLSSTADNATPPIAETADPGKAAESTEPTPIDYDREFTRDEGHAVLQQVWGDSYQENLAMTEHAAREIFKDDPKSLELISSTLGNHPLLIQLGYRIACMLNGARPGKVDVPNTQQLDAALAAFKPGGSKYEQWLGGDTKLNQQRIELYRRRYPGKATIG